MADKMVFKPVAGSHLTTEQAERYGHRLYELHQELDGLTPEDVVSDAQLANSPLHDYFEWDDTVAANGYRDHQARYLLRNINVVVTSQGHEHEVRFLHAVKVEDARRYIAVNIVLEQPDLHSQIIEEALRQLQAWQRKYREYKDLHPVVSAIETALAQLPGMG